VDGDRITITPPEAAGSPVAIEPPALLRLLQLVSPALPIGSFAYSQGLEAAVAAGWIHDEDGAAAWIEGLLVETLATLDLAVMVRLYRAWDEGLPEALADWGALLIASRPSGELQAEERHLGSNLARLLAGLRVAGADPWITRAEVTYATMFALAASRWRVPVGPAALGYAFAWLEAQTSAAVRLVPLGQTAGQRILMAASRLIPEVVRRAQTVVDDEVGAAAPSQSIASARHETQYSRLFRS
jgi:urease accessory protein